MRGTQDAYLSQLVILDELRPVPVDQGIKGKTVLPAGDGKAKVMRMPAHCNGSAWPQEPTATISSHLLRRFSVCARHCREMDGRVAVTLTAGAESYGVKS